MQKPQILVAILIATGAIGCASMASRTDLSSWLGVTSYGPSYPYPGVKASTRYFRYQAEPQHPFEFTFLLVDFPLTTVADTIMLPFDLPRAAHAPQDGKTSPTP